MANITEQELQVARTIVGRMSTLEAIYKETEATLDDFRKGLEEKYGEIEIDLSTGEYKEVTKEEQTEE